LPHSISLAPFFSWPPSRHPFNLSLVHLPIFPLARGAPTTNGNSTWGHCDLSVIGSLFGLLKKQFSGVYWYAYLSQVLPPAAASTLHSCSSSVFHFSRCFFVRAHGTTRSWHCGVSTLKH
jgi:hypothetical protein